MWIEVDQGRVAWRMPVAVSSLSNSIPFYSYTACSSFLFLLIPLILLLSFFISIPPFSFTFSLQHQQQQQSPLDYANHNISHPLLCWCMNCVQNACRRVPFPFFAPFLFLLFPSLSQFRISLVLPFKLSLSISLNPFSAPRTSFPVHYHLELEWFECLPACQPARENETTQRTITFYAIHHILSLVFRAISNSSVPPPLSDFLSVSLSAAAAAAAAGAHLLAPFSFKWLISEMCSFLRRYFSLIFRFALCLSLSTIFLTLVWQRQSQANGGVVIQSI